MSKQKNSIQICAFEVRPDEAASFDAWENQLGIALRRVCGPVCEANAEKAEGCIGITILGESKLDAGLLDALYARGVRYVTTRTIGYNHIDLAHAKKLGMGVCNADYAPNGVADYTVMLILMCLRHYKQALWRGQVNDYSLAGLEGREMKDLTIGVWGTGRIGCAVLENLSGFGCRLLAYGRHESEQAKRYARYVSLDTLLKECDVISLHTPLTPENYHMVNAETIAKMKKGMILINCARGALCDEAALVDAIESEQLGALGLDCAEEENGIYHCDRRTDIFSNRTMAYLRQFHNVIMTQHMAFYTDAAVESMVRCGLQGLWLMLQGEECKTRLV